MRSNQSPTRQQCQTMAYATTVCQLYHKLFPNQSSWRFEVRIILSIMDNHLGPEVPSERRRLNDSLVDRSGLGDEIVMLIDSLRDRERQLESRQPPELEDCVTLDQAIQWLYRPRLMETLVLVRTFVTLDERVYFPSIWRRLWAGNIDSLHMNIRRIVQPQEPDADGLPSNSNEDREQSPSIPQRSSGNDYDVRLIREPDPFDILGSILYPGAFDECIPVTTSGSSMRTAESTETRGRSEHRSTSGDRSTSRHRSTSAQRSTSSHRLPSSHRSRSGRRSTSSRRSTSGHRSASSHRASPIRGRRLSTLNPNPGSLIRDRSPIRRHRSTYSDRDPRQPRLPIAHLIQQPQPRREFLRALFENAWEEREERESRQGRQDRGEGEESQKSSDTENKEHDKTR